MTEFNKEKQLYPLSFIKKKPQLKDIQWAQKEIEAKEKGAISPTRLELEKKLASL